MQRRACVRAHIKFLECMPHACAGSKLRKLPLWRDPALLMSYRGCGGPPRNSFWRNGTPMMLMMPGAGGGGGGVVDGK